MPADTFAEYYKAMDAIEAKESLNLINPISYPHYKKHAQKKAFDSLKKRFNESYEQSNSLMTYGDLVKQLKAKMNG